MQPDQQQRILGYFIEEAKDHLNTIEQGLLNLQSTIEDSEMINEVFRAAHSVKGGAAMLGLNGIQRVSHRLEDFFKVLKESPLKVDQKLETLFLKAFDGLQEMLGQLQGPFGLTEDTANQILTRVEPTFTELEGHLNELASAAGTVPQPAIATSAFSLDSHTSALEPALEQWFRNDVPARLREMLQLFKRSESEPAIRQQLQELCRSLGSMGEQYQLDSWCHLVETARRAIAHPDNQYRVLAPVVIKDIKFAQELVLAGRPLEIVASSQLQDLLPAPTAMADMAADDDLVDLLEDDFAAGLDLDTDLADDQFGELSLEATDNHELDFSDLTQSGQDYPSADLADQLEGLDGLDEPLDESLLDMQNGPEVGMAELNSLADLFEGEMPELGLTWQEEEILMEGADLFPADATDTEAGDETSDFSDLLFDSNETATPPTDSDDFGDLFGDELNAPPPTNQATASEQTTPASTTDDDLDEFGDLLEISSSSASPSSDSFETNPVFDTYLPDADPASDIDLDLGLSGLLDSDATPDLDFGGEAELELDHALGDLGDLFDGLNEGDLAAPEAAPADAMSMAADPWDTDNLEESGSFSDDSELAGLEGLDLSDADAAIAALDLTDAELDLDDANFATSPDTSSTAQDLTADASASADVWAQDNGSDLWADTPDRAANETDDALADLGLESDDAFADLGLELDESEAAGLDDFRATELDFEADDLFTQTQLEANNGEDRNSELSFEADDLFTQTQFEANNGEDDLFTQTQLEANNGEDLNSELSFEADDLFTQTQLEANNGEDRNSELFFADLAADETTETGADLALAALTSDVADPDADELGDLFSTMIQDDINFFNNGLDLGDFNDSSDAESLFETDDLLSLGQSSDEIDETDDLLDFGPSLDAIDETDDLLDFGHSADEIDQTNDLLGLGQSAEEIGDLATDAELDFAHPETDNTFDDLGTLESIESSDDAIALLGDLDLDTSELAAETTATVIDDRDASAIGLDLADMSEAPNDFLSDLNPDEPALADLSEADFGDLDLDTDLGLAPSDDANFGTVMDQSLSDREFRFELDHDAADESNDLDIFGDLDFDATESTDDTSDHPLGDLDLGTALDLDGTDSTDITDNLLGDLDLDGAWDLATEESADAPDAFGDMLAASSDRELTDTSPAPDDFLAGLDLGDLETGDTTADDLNDLDHFLDDTDAALGTPHELTTSTDTVFEPSPLPDSSPLATDEFGDLENLLDSDPSESFAELDDLLDDAPPITDAAALGAFAFGDLGSTIAPSGSGEDFADLESLLSNDGPEDPPTEISTPSNIDTEFGDLDELLKDAEERMPGSPTVKVGAGMATRRPTRPNRGFGEQTMRVPVKHLDNLNNLVGELVVNRNSLEQDQERLRQSLDNLLYQVQQLSDVGQRMQDLYERSLLESSLLASRHGYRPSVFHAKPSDTTVVEMDAEHSTGIEYDPLEMDRFTGFHSLSQEMIELIVRVRESSSDIEFIVDETEQVTRMFRQVTTQLQEGLTRSRMVPFAQTADRLPRAVRDISIKVGKQADLVVEGRETLIDKMILEQLYDPMTHLVNNAITHGIEPPSVRVAAGKPPAGRITIRAFHQGNQTIISVSDDGAGIDVERVKTKAIEKGLMTATEARNMTRLDIYDLLFHPGFSTKDQADDFSGRGVGMDVVRTSLSEIRGAINTDSNPGKGTTFTIRLPLTLSISKALCCVSERARIAFPMDGVEDMLDIPKDRIQTNAEGQACIAWRDTILPVRPLAELLGYNRLLSRGTVYGGNQEDDMVSIVVLRSTGNFLALQVDQVMGEQEIVIKQLEGPVPKPVGVAGATVLGDGRIMPIADVLELIDLSMGRIRRDTGGSLWEQGGVTAVAETPAAKTEPMVLIVDDSITVRELLSMTFNKVGYRVEQARDGQEAWEKLRSGLPCDIVFCDIEMPRMDGLELLSRIQKDINLKHLPIAMLTSRGADRHRQMAASLGASGYFTKPYLEEALLDAAQRMLKGERLL